MWEWGDPSKNVHICDVILMSEGGGALKKYFWCRRSVMIGVLVFFLLNLVVLVVSGISQGMNFMNI